MSAIFLTSKIMPEQSCDKYLLNKTITYLEEGSRQNNGSYARMEKLKSKCLQNEILIRIFIFVMTTLLLLQPKKSNKLDSNEESLPRSLLEIQAVCGMPLSRKDDSRMDSRLTSVSNGTAGGGRTGKVEHH